MSSSIKIYKSIQQLIGNKCKSIDTNSYYILKKSAYNNNKNFNFLCWKSKCIYDEYSHDNKIFTIDYNINNDILKIKHLSINNDYYEKNNIIKNNNLLTNEETLKIKRYIFNYLSTMNINKITIDIHSNLNRYNYELKDEGFVITNKRCYSNPFWIEAEKNVYKN